MKMVIVGLMALMMVAAGCNCTTKVCCGTCKGGEKAVEVKKACCGTCKTDAKAEVKCTKCGEGVCKCEKK